MYIFFMGDVPLPVTPSKLQIRTKNQNKTINLINEGEVNLLKSPGLREITFEAMIPQVKYPFAYYSLGFLNAAFFLQHFEKLKADKKPFQFIVIRILPHGIPTFTTNIKVGFEDYTVLEDAKNGQDLLVNIKLKEYKNFGTKIFDYDPETKTATIKITRPTDNKPSIKTYIAKAGDTLWSVAKQFLGDGGKYLDLMKLNKLNSNTLEPGQIIKVE
jgi:LysM repeat protein